MRNTLLQLVASPDRAWITLLGGMLLLFREFTAPGRVIPGVAGGLGIILAIYGLSGYRFAVAGPPLIGAAVAAIVVGGRMRSWYPGAVLAAGLGAVGARLLLAPPWQISLLVAILTAPVMVLFAFLLHTGILAHKNKQHR